MLKNRLLQLSILILMFVFTACGGGTSNDTSTQSNIDNTAVKSTISSAQYVDAPISNVHYQCGTESGVTDDQGIFHFEEGKSCTFTLGKIQLRKILAGMIVQNGVIFEDNLLVSRFLQTLDEDGNPDNGITISPAVIKVLDGKLEIPDTVEEYKALLTELEKTTGKVYIEVSKEKALKHLKKTKDALGMPTITLLGDEKVTLALGNTYIDAGAEATDPEDGTIDVGNDATTVVNSNKIGDYVVTYTATDSDLHIVTKTRVVTVKDNTTPDTIPPSITLNGASEVTVNLNATYSDSGATCTDNIDYSCTVISSGTVNTAVVNTYIISYNATDNAGNHATTVRRTVKVVDPTAISNGTNTGGGTQPVPTSTPTPPAPTPTPPTATDVVIMNHLMWEKTSHAVPQVSPNGTLLNGLTYTEANNYCNNLELAGYTDWRLPHADWDSYIGYTRTNNELISLRLPPLDKNGDVWEFVDNSSYSQIDENSSTSIEPFTATQRTGGAYWTDDGQQMHNAHMAMIFAYSIDNGDGFSDGEELSVRCVRTLSSNYHATLSVNAGADQEIEINNPVTLTATVSHLNPIQSYEWKYGATVIGTTASFSYLPTSVGTKVITLKVTDNVGLTAWDLVHINVTEANRPPVVEAGADQTVQVGNSITITGTASDSDGSIVSYEWKNGNDVLANTASFDYVPSSTGTKTLTFTVTDNDGVSVADTMQIVVSEAPDSIPDAFHFTDTTDVELSVEQIAQVEILGINTDATISIINGEYSLNGGSTWSNSDTTVGNNQVVKVKHTSSDQYTTEINTTLTVGGVSDTFTSTTRAYVDQPPHVEITNQNITTYLGASSPYIDSIISDDTGVTYCKWQDANGGIVDEATINPADQNPYGVCQLNNLTFSHEGNYTYRLTATDTENQSTTKELNITVLPNATPTADIGTNREITVGSTLNIVATVNDADGDNMDYQWMYGIKGSGSMTGAGATVNFSNSFNSVGLYVVTFRVADEHGATVTEEIDVNVTEEDKYSGAAAPGDFARFYIAESDSEMNLTYELNGTVFGEQSGTISLTPATAGDIFYFGDLGNGQIVKIALANNLGIAIVPTDNSGATTLVSGLAVTEDVNETKLTGGNHKNYIYAEIDNDGNISGNILTVRADYKFQLTNTEGDEFYGCWKSLIDHIVVLVDAKASDSTEVDCSDLSGLNDGTASARVVVKPGVSRAGLVVDLVDGSGFGIGLEQKPLTAADVNGTFQMFGQLRDGSTELYQIQVGSDGNGGYGYETTPYECDQQGCVLSTDQSNVTTGSIEINQLCDGTAMDGVLCADGNTLGFIDPVDGYFLMTNQDGIFFGAK